VATRKRKATLKGIPTKIWQTWKSKELAPRIVPYVESWKANTDYEYSYNDDEDCKSFIDSLDDQDIKVCYDKMPLPVMKADLWRYLIVYTHGGVYSDIDTQCNKSIPEWITDDAKLVLCLENDLHFCQWTFAASKHHPALKSVIDAVIYESKGYIDTSYEHFVHKTTGPGAFTLGILNYLSFITGHSMLKASDSMPYWDELSKYGIYISDKELFSSTAVSHKYASQWTDVREYDSWTESVKKITREAKNYSHTESEFNKVYSDKLWGGGSGPGSTVDYCRDFSSFLNTYLADVDTLCDLGCGDMAWIGQTVIDPLKIKYIGVDCVGGLIKSHAEVFKANQNYSFWHLEFSEISKFPAADVYLIKDVLQHWPSDKVYQWLSDFFVSNPKSKIIVVNCNHQSGSRNLNMAGFVPLHADYYPLVAFDCTHLFSWHSKTAYLVTSRKVAGTKAKIEALSIYSTEHGKIRVGRECDGGYVIADAGEYDHFVSAGVGDDVSFEHHLLANHPNLRCDIFDGTVSGVPATHDRMSFHRKNIGSGASDTNLHDLISAHSNIFLKMDIEGGEYEFFRSMTDELMCNIKQIVLEVHDPKNKGWWLLEKIAKTHTLVHFHGNNHSEIDEVSGVIVPSVMECTYLRTDCIKDLKHTTEVLPGPLDRPCGLGKADLGPFNYYPFIR
jgi:hypothetical protein